MIKVIVFIERGNDGSYGAYVNLNDNRLNYGIFGNGSTVNESIDDFHKTYEEMKALHKELNKDFIEAQFEFRYDVASFLSYYSKKFTLAGLQEITGINQGQLSHYVTGHRKPSTKTVQKIEKSLHDFATEIGQIHFI